MEPITRKEKYLAKIGGDYSGTVPKPVTRLDYYMAFVAGGDGPLPTPIKREERYWAYICGATDIYLPEPVTRIEKYLGAICGGMILLPEPITREEMYLYKIAKQSQYVSKVVEGRSVIFTDSLEAPFEDFHIYGHSTQETTTGAQLLDFSTAQNVSNADTGLEIVINGDGSYTISGKCLADGYLYMMGAHDLDPTIAENVLFTLPAGDYAVTGCTIVSGTTAYNYTFTLAEDLSVTGVRNLSLIEGRNYNDTIFPMLEEGTGYSAWEPYTGGWPSPSPDYPQKIVSAGDGGNITVSVTDRADNVQSLTLSTPNGLPGIPVFSGGNYTDENGQWWVCDEIDFVRGVYVQRVKWFEVNENTVIGSMNPYATLILDKFQPFRADEYTLQIIKNSPMYCSKLKNEQSWNKPKECCYSVEESIDFNISNERLGTNAQTSLYEAVDALKEWLKDNPMKFLCCLKNPIETDLALEQLAAYHALHTYKPTTTIWNDAEAWMKVGYKAKPVSQYDEARTLEYLKVE